MSGPAAAKKNCLADMMRRWGWAYDVPRNGARARLYSLARDRHPWWDWGHRLMILVGDDFGGNWSSPKSPTWWYRQTGTKRMWRTGYPRRVFTVVTDYDEFQALTDGLNEDEMYAWKAIGTNQDGEIHLGHQYWGKSFYGIPHDEQVIVRCYLRRAHRHNWFGLRSWLYSQGLNAAVYQRKPGACHQAPPRESGGYSHWLCQEKRRHGGPHRFNAYTWDDGQVIHVAAAPPETKP